MVYDSEGGRAVGPPMAVSCTSLACDWDLIIVKLTVLIAQGDEAGCASTRVGLLVFLFVVEE